MLTETAEFPRPALMRHQKFLYIERVLPDNRLASENVRLTSASLIAIATLLRENQIREIKSGKIKEDFCT